MDHWQNNGTISSLTAWLNRYASLIVAGILFAFLIVSLCLARQDSLIMDEQAHIPAAYSYVAFGDMRLNPEHPPLIKDLVGLSLLALKPNFPVTDNAWTNGVNEQWKLGQTFLFASGNDPDLIAWWSRLPIILLAVLLGWFIYRWTSELAGKIAGFGALLMYVSDPNIIAHSHYVTTDIGIAALVFIATYYFVRWLKKPTFRSLLAAGVVLGLAQVTKFSAVLLWPLYGIVALLYAILSASIVKSRFVIQSSIWRRIWAYVGKYVGLVCVSGLVIWVVYALSTANTPLEKIREIASSSLSHSGISQTATRMIDTFSGISILKPVSEYILGVMMVHDRVQSGSTIYFLGTVATGGSGSYFPVVFLMKETIPFLLLLIVALVVAGLNTLRAVRHRTVAWTEFVRRSVRQHIAQYAMFAFVAVYAYFSIKENLNIGFRHLFPILPFLYVLVACAIASLVRRWLKKGLTSGQSHAFTIVMGAIALWIVAIPVSAFPNYLSYFNETVGGHTQGYRYVTDSNYDWGQDLKRLQTWVREYNTCATETAAADCVSEKLKISAEVLARIDPSQPITTIQVDYFGGDNPQYRLGQMVVESHSSDAPAVGWHAISLEYYQESIHRTKQPGVQSYDWLTNVQPVGQAGDSILIFYIKPTDLPVEKTN